MIVPAVLEKNWQEVQKKLALLKGLSSYVQIDIIDSWPHAQNTLGLDDLLKYRKAGSDGRDRRKNRRHRTTFTQKNVSFFQQSSL